MLAVTREWCVFHVDGMWTSTREEGGCISCGHMWTERGQKHWYFCGHHKFI